MFLRSFVCCYLLIHAIVHCQVHLTLMTDLVQPEHVFVNILSIEAPNLSNNDYCDEFGSDYFGNVSQTVSGQPCAPWPSEYINQINQVAGLEQGAYCRDPYKNATTPWCFIQNGSREDCNVSMYRRSENDIFYAIRDYNGTLAVSSTGEACISISGHPPHCFYDDLKRKVGCYVSGQVFVECDVTPCCTGARCGSVLSLVQNIELTVDNPIVFPELRLDYGYYRITITDELGRPTLSSAGGVYSSSEVLTLWKFDQSVQSFKYQRVMPCQDDDYFLDELGFRCLDWANSDCALAESDGLSYGGMMDLYKYCPVSCIPYGCDSNCYSVYIGITSMDGDVYVTISNCQGTLYTLESSSNSTVYQTYCFSSEDTVEIVQYGEWGDTQFEVDPIGDAVIGDCGDVKQVSFANKNDHLQTSTKLNNQSKQKQLKSKKANKQLEEQIESKIVKSTGPIDGIYLSANGDDHNNGLTRNSAVATFSQAVNLVLQSETQTANKIFLLSGTFELQQTTANRLALGLEKSCFTIQLFDSWGDGWEGGNMYIRACDQEFTLFTFTLLDGDYSVENFCLSSSSGFTVEVTGGDYPLEITWTIFEGDGFVNEVLSGGAPETQEYCSHDVGFPMELYIQNQGKGTLQVTDCNDNLLTQREIPYEAADLMIPAKIVNAGFKVGLQSPLEPSNLEWVLSYGHRVMTRASGFANEAVQSFGCSSSQTIHVKLQVTTPDNEGVDFNILDCSGNQIWSVNHNLISEQYDIPSFPNVSHGFFIYISPFNTQWELNQVISQSQSMMLLSGNSASASTCPSKCNSSQFELSVVNWGSTKLEVYDCSGHKLLDFSVSKNNINISSVCIDKSLLKNGYTIKPFGLFAARDPKVPTIFFNDASSLGSCTKSPSRGNGICDNDMNNDANNWDDGDCCYATCIGELCSFEAKDCKEKKIEIIGVDGKETTFLTTSNQNWRYPWITMSSTWEVVLTNITVVNTSFTLSGLVWAQNYSRLLIDNCAFLHMNSFIGSVIRVEDFAYIKIQNSIFSNNSALNFGGSIAMYGTSVIEIENSTFTHGSAELLGGDIAIVSESGPFALLSTSLFQSSSSLFGGSVAVVNNISAQQNDNSISLSFSNSKFLNCEATLHGGCALISSWNVLVNQTTISGKTGNHGSGGGLILLSNAAIFRSATLANSIADKGGAVYCTGSTSSLYVENTVFSNNSALSGGAAMFENGCQPNIFTSQFDSNKAVYLGGGIYVDSLVNVSSSTFGSNIASQGGAIYAQITLPSMIVGTFSANNASYQGGAIFVSTPRDTPLSVAGDFKYNQATQGGAIYSTKATLFIPSSVLNTQFTSNNASIGGAIYLSQTIVRSYSSIFNLNTADRYGGAMYFENSEFSVENAVFDSNSAGIHGGALYFISNSYLTIKDCQFMNNFINQRPTNLLITSTNFGFGGAVHASGLLQSMITNTNFSHNTAFNGGGLYLELSVINITSCNFIQCRTFANQATPTAIVGSNGGAVSVSALSSGSLIANCTFVNNSADYTGGGFFASGSSHGMQDLQFTQNSANNGGALAAIHTYFSSFLRVNIANNTGIFTAGGLYLVDCVATYENLTVVGNAAPVGGGMVASQFLQSVLAINNARFEENTAREGGGVLFTDMIVMLSDVQFISNNANRCGGIEATRSNLGINKASFANNNGGVNGGAICASYFDYFNMTDSTLVSNNATYLGGALFISGSSIISTSNITSCEFKDNGIADFGGAIYFESANWMVADSTFISNSANTGGGAIYSQCIGSVIGSDFYNNSCTSYGGGIFAVNANQNIDTSTFKSNSASEGGAICVFESPLIANSVSFESNQAQSSGGAVAMEKSDFSSLDSCVFTSNTALNGSGGALYVTISSNISISNAVFFNNTAFSGGGAVFWDKSGYTEKNSSYEGNTANFGSDYASSPARISVEYLGSDPVVNSFFHDSVTVYIWDQYDQLFTSTTDLTVSATVEETSKLLGSRTSSFYDGVASFDNLVLGSGCGNHHRLTFTVSDFQANATIRVFLECKLDDFNVVALLIIACIFIVVDLIIVHIVIIHRKAPLFSRSSPQFCVSQLSGDVLILVGVVTYLSTTTEASCSASIALWCIGFTIAFGSLGLKTWRVKKLFDNHKLEKVELPNKLLFRGLAIMVLVDVIILIAWFSALPLKRIPIRLYHEEKMFYGCKLSKSSPFAIIMIVYKLSFILWSIVLAYRVRQLFTNDSKYKEFNESKYIMYCIYNMVFLLILVFPIVIALSESQWKLKLVLVCVIIFATTQFNALLLFVPKVVSLYSTVLTERGSVAVQILNLLTGRKVSLLSNFTKRRSQVSPQLATQSQSVTQDQ